MDEVTGRLESLTISQMDDVLAERLLAGAQRIFVHPSPNRLPPAFLYLPYNKQRNSFTVFFVNVDVLVKFHKS